MRRWAWLVAPLVLAASLASAAEDGVAAARALLAAQRDAGNRGDIDAFMRGYWKSDELRFASGDTIERGFATTLERYRRTYPDRAAMGTLAFELIEVRALGPDAVTVFGRWRLARERDTPHGLFTLLVERKDGAWVITRDHTSAAP